MEDQNKVTEEMNNKPTKGLRIAIIVLASLFVVGLIVFLSINLSITGYKSVAEKYDKAVKAGDFDKAYECLNVDDSVFLTKEAYSIRQSVIADVVQGISIQDTVEKIGKKAYDFILNRFANVNYEVLEANQDGDEAVVTFKLSPRYDMLSFLSENKTIKLKKCSHNHMGIFSNWKVVDDTVIAENIKLNVPNSKKAYIDGIEIPEEYFTGEENGMKIYVIPGLFTGSHVCTTTDDEVTFKNYNITAGRSNTEIIVKDVSLDEEQRQNVINASYDAFKAVIEAEARGAEFDEVASYFAPEYRRIEKAKYDEDKKSFYSAEEQTGITSAEISDVKGSIYNEAFTDGTLEVSVQLDYKDTNKGKINTYVLGVFEGTDDNHEITQVMRMQYVDGRWVVSSFGDNRIIDYQWFFGSR